MNALISYNIDLIQWVSTLGLAPYYLILYMSFIQVGRNAKSIKEAEFISPNLASLPSSTHRVMGESFYRRSN